MTTNDARVVPVASRPFHPSMAGWATAAAVSPPLALSRVGTSFEHRPDMSAKFGRDVYLKREDEIDSLGCGHKLRKLSFLAPAILDAGTTMLVTVGSLPSNQCKAVARAAYLCGIKAHVLYLGDCQRRPTTAHGNYLVTSLLKPTITWYERTPWVSADALVKVVVAQETARGERPWVLSSGLSQDLGLLASIELGFEIDDELGQRNHERVAVVAVAGSGGTCLGLKLAAEYRGRRWRVFGCVIGESDAAIRDRIRDYRKGFQHRFGWGGQDDGRLMIMAETLGGGYDRPRTHEIETMQHVARDYGLLFDLNYMIKAYIGLERLVASPAFDDIDCIVLLHSGGHFGIFDENPAFSRWHAGNFLDWVAAHCSFG